MEHSLRREDWGGREREEGLIKNSEALLLSRGGEVNEKTLFAFNRASLSLLLCFSFLLASIIQCTRWPSGALRSSRPARRRRALRRAAGAGAVAAGEGSPDRRRCLRLRRRNRRSPCFGRGRFRPLRSLPRYIPLAIGSSTSAATPPGRRRTSRGARSQVRK